MLSHTPDTFENLIVDRQPPLAIVTVNRPRVLNAMNTQTLDELRRVMLGCQADAEVRAVVVTGAGDKAFAAGADIRELAVLTPAGAREHARRGQAVFDVIAGLGKPVVAAINGYALGGGCELAMACTIRIAAESARLGQPEVNLGIIPGFGGTQRLSRLVGAGRALELMLTGDQITAAEAYRVGLVNRVVPAADLMAEAVTLATTLAGKAPIAVRYIMEAVETGLELPLPAAQVLEATLFGLAASTGDMREGTQAFLEKRQAAFRGQ
jgi:enoyl-CoA hydratase